MPKKWPHYTCMGNQEKKKNDEDYPNRKDWISVKDKLPTRSEELVYPDDYENFLVTDGKK